MAKVAIVTGGIKGIGKAIVEELLLKKFNVYTTFYSDEKTAVEMSRKYKNLYVYKSDVKDYQATKKLVNEIILKEHKIDVLVNNAGKTNDKSLSFMSEKSWKDIIDTNLNGTFNFTKLVGNQMIRKKSGVIVNISSVASNYTMKGQSNYASSKAGIEALTRVSAKEFSPFNIRVNSVSPGYIQTDMTSMLDVTNKILLGRMGNTEEVAKVVDFLVSSSASYITGQNIVVDGGLSI